MNRLFVLLAAFLCALPSQALYKNVASQDVCLVAWDTSADGPKTGDAANIDFYVDLDNGGTGAQIAAGAVTETDATNMPGVYCANLAQADTNGNMAVFSGTSSTADIEISAMVVYTRPGDSGDVPGEVTVWNTVALSTTNPLPNAADGAAGGLPTDSTGKTAFNDVTQGQITGGAYALDTDANGRIRIVDGAGVGELNTLAGRIVLVDGVTTLTGHTPQTADHTAGIAAIPTVSELEARVGFFESGTTPSQAGIADCDGDGGTTDEVILAAAAVDTNSNLRGYRVTLKASAADPQTCIVDEACAATETVSCVKAWQTTPTAGGGDTYELAAFGAVPAALGSGATTLNTDANGNIRIVDGTGVGELDSESGTVLLRAATETQIDNVDSAATEARLAELDAANMPADLDAVAAAATEARLAELDAANMPAVIDTIDGRSVYIACADVVTGNANNTASAFEVDFAPYGGDNAWPDDQFTTDSNALPRLVVGRSGNIQAAASVLSAWDTTGGASGENWITISPAFTAEPGGSSPRICVF